MLFGIVIQKERMITELLEAKTIYLQKIIRKTTLYSDLYSDKNKNWKLRVSRCGKYLNYKDNEQLIKEAEKQLKVINRFLRQYEEYVKKWQSEIYKANTLFQLSIPYKYEHPLMLKNGKTVYPDFTALNIRKRKEICIEHFGLIDYQDYRSKCLTIIELYSDSDVFIGDNLIVFFEEREKPLNTSYVQQILTHYLKEK